MKIVWKHERDSQETKHGKESNPSKTKRSPDSLISGHQVHTKGFEQNEKKSNEKRKREHHLQITLRIRIKRIGLV